MDTVIRDGHLVKDAPSIKEARDRAMASLRALTSGLSRRA